MEQSKEFSLDIVLRHLKQEPNTPFAVNAKGLLGPILEKIPEKPEIQPPEYGIDLPYAW